MILGHPGISSQYIRGTVGLGYVHVKVIWGSSGAPVDIPKKMIFCKFSFHL